MREVAVDYWAERAAERVIVVLIIEGARLFVISIRYASLFVEKKLYSFQIIYLTYLVDLLPAMLDISDVLYLIYYIYNLNEDSGIIIILPCSKYVRLDRSLTQSWIVQKAVGS